MEENQPSIGELLRRLGPVIALVWVSLPLTFLVPWLNSTSPPYVDLTGWIGTVAYALAVLGGREWTPWVVGFLILVTVSRPGLVLRRRVVEALVIFAVLSALLGGGSAVNGYVLKQSFKEARPHIELLARTPDNVPLEQSILKMSPDSLYRLDRATRRAYLESISGYDEIGNAGSSRRYCFEEYDAELHLSRDVCRHWASMTGGYSFPSGHAFSAMFIVTFFLGLALSLMGGWRLWFFQSLVVPYGVLVAYCRVVLRVHSPLDISIGGLLGIGAGLAALMLVVAGLPRATCPCRGAGTE